MLSCLTKIHQIHNIPEILKSIKSSLFSIHMLQHRDFFFEEKDTFRFLKNSISFCISFSGNPSLHYFDLALDHISCHTFICYSWYFSSVKYQLKVNNFLQILNFNFLAYFLSGTSSTVITTMTSRMQSSFQIGWNYFYGDLIYVTIFKFTLQDNFLRTFLRQNITFLISPATELLILIPIDCLMLCFQDCILVISI